MRLRSSLVAVSLLAGTAAAAAVTGDLSVGSLDIADVALGEANVLAAYWEDAQAITNVQLVAASLTVHRWEARSVEVRSVLPGVSYVREFSYATYRLTNAKVTLEGTDHQGWLGYRSDAGGAVTLALTEGAFSYAPHDELGRRQQASDRDAPEHAAFDERSVGPIVRVEQISHLVADGSFQLRVGGPDLLIRSDQNTSREPTGFQRDDAPAGETIIRWLSLNASGATFEVAGGRAAAHASRARVQWDGPATVAEAQGTIRGGGDAWLVQDEGVITGDLSATLSLGEGAIGLALEGDLAATTFPASARAPAPLTSPAFSWALLVLGVLAGAGGVFALHRRAVRRSALAPDQLHDLASQALEEERYEKALEWLRRARQASPGSRRLAHDEIFALTQLGRYAEALEIARPLAAEDAEAAWHVARLLTLQRADPRDVVPWLVKALDLDPMVLHQIRDDPILDAARTFPSVRAKTAEAERRMG